MKHTCFAILIFLNASVLQAQQENDPLLQKQNELTFTPQVQTHSRMNGVPEAWVRHYASGNAPTTLSVSDATVDQDDNIYVTGWVANTPYGYDYFTAKYFSNGQLLWMTLYNGEANRDDIAWAICLDADGNVIVTGNSDGFSGSQVVTVKYSPAGIEQWRAVQKGPDGGYARASDITTDPSNNIIVVGESERNFTIAKYLPNGESLWSRTVASEHNYGFGMAVAVDEQGQLYATGTISDESTEADYFTVKYSADGEEQWTARYNSEVNGDDYANALALDRNGNLVVTGRAATSLGAYFDYMTIKYDSLGNQIWARSYNGPANDQDKALSVKIDSSGNIYVTGESEGGETHADFATIKYSAAGEQLWVARYDGPGNADDRYPKLQLGEGSVIVTGYSFSSDYAHSFWSLIEYDRNGSEEWVTLYGDGMKQHRVNALAIGSNSDITVAGTRSGSNQQYDLLVAQFDANGTENWVQTYRREGNSDDKSEALAFDDAGNIYVAATSTVVGSGSDILIIKYTPTGEVEWEARYNGPANGPDDAVDLAVDAAGNIYVTGESRNTIFNSAVTDIATLKYSADGELLWAEHYKNPDAIRDNPVALALDASGNVYITGNSGVGNIKMVTIAYSATGRRKWEQLFSTLEHEPAFPEAIHVDHSGSVFVTGSSSDSLTSFDITTIKYDPTGREGWVRHYDGAGDFSYDRGRAQTLDLTGHLYVTGVADGQIVTIKYAPSGEQLWVAVYGTEDVYEQPRAIAVDGGGRVHVLGEGGGAVIMIQYDRDGNKNWAAQPGGVSLSFGSSPLQVDGFGNLYVAGAARGPGSSIDFATLKYNPDGQLQWRSLYNRPENTPEEVQAIAVDGWGNVYVTGTSANSSAGGIVTTIKYTQDELVNRPRDFNLSQSYPNPFNGSTIIRYRLENLSDVTLTIYNMRGQEVATLVNSAQMAGEHEVSWNPRSVAASGTYLYRLQVDNLNPAGQNFSEVGKLVFLK